MFTHYAQISLHLLQEGCHCCLFRNDCPDGEGTHHHGEGMVITAVVATMIYCGKRHVITTIQTAYKEGEYGCRGHAARHTHAFRVCLIVGSINSHVMVQLCIFSGSRSVDIRDQIRLSLRPFQQFGPCIAVKLIVSRFATCRLLLAKIEDRRLLRLQLLAI